MALLTGNFKVIKSVKFGERLSFNNMLIPSQANESK